jgi:hypothetical protein
VLTHTASERIVRSAVSGGSGRPVAPGRTERPAEKARWAVPVSNQRPPACKAGALPAELTARAASVPHPAEAGAVARLPFVTNDSTSRLIFGRAGRDREYSP